MNIFKSFRRYVAYFVFLLIGIIIGYNALFIKNTIQKNYPASTESRLGGYKFTNPLLECNTALPSSLMNILNIKEKTTRTVDLLKKKSEIDDITVYFRDMNNGPWFGIDENMQFAPASMLKVPILIYYLKQAETNPSLLQQEYPVNTINETNVNITPAQTVQINKKYTIEQLLEFMIIHSDNSAKKILDENMDNVEYATMLHNLGVDIDLDVDEIDFMSVREYSSFFRILYNASYLSKDMSEKALSMLSKTNFTAGIVAGVPQSVPVAHKFGERRYLDLYDNVTLQLHDCGIVYYPKKPYLVCIMSRGNDFSQLSKAIQRVSMTIYQGVKGFPY